MHVHSLLSASHIFSVTILWVGRFTEPACPGGHGWGGALSLPVLGVMDGEVPFLGCSETSAVSGDIWKG